MVPSCTLSFQQMENLSKCPSIGVEGMSVDGRAVNASSCDLADIGILLSPLGRLTSLISGCSSHVWGDTWGYFCEHSEFLSYILYIFPTATVNTSQDFVTVKQEKSVPIIELRMCPVLDILIWGQFYQTGALSIASGLGNLAMFNHVRYSSNVCGRTRQ